ncbi:hypothetical protein E4U54_007538 [Claviceps lovelessii]|nr:hypothetical protein E4U54_007538 [Claviceps lovelessii]
MKFGTVLGSLFLMALQASAASLPPDIDLNPTGWCCTKIPAQLGYHGVRTYIPRGKAHYVFSVARCEIVVSRPSPDNCDGYTFEVVNDCDLYGNIAVQPSEFCTGPADPAVHLPLAGAGHG